jgi:phosphatidylinositol alpha-mannosyltransferase
MSPQLSERTEFLGRVTDQRKQEFLRSIALYVAPNTGGESFGIILAEAMAAGAPVLASNLPAFHDVLEGGKVGEIFEVGNSTELAIKIAKLLGQPERRMELSALGQRSALRFDWSQVGESILDIYQMVSASGEKIRLGSDLRFSRAKMGREE